MTVALTLLAVPVHAATIPILNSDFETGPNGNQPGRIFGLRDSQLATTNPGWDSYTGLSGWTKSGGGWIEHHHNRSAALNAQSGSYSVSLDGGPGRNATISQDVTLTAGSYILSFWYSPQSLNAATNEVAYNLGNVVSGRVTAGTNGASVGVWTQVRHRIGILTPGTYTLTFAALGAADGVGGYIDNVELTTAVPVPAAAAGLAGALGLLGLVGIRRRAGAARS
jgi:hypothetical protein